MPRDASLSRIVDDEFLQCGSVTFGHIVGCQFTWLNINIYIAQYIDHQYCGANITSYAVIFEARTLINLFSDSFQFKRNMINKETVFLSISKEYDKKNTVFLSV